MPENILIYYPSNKPSNVIETLAIGCAQAGHQVFLLTQSEQGQLHDTLISHKIQVYAHVVPKSNGLLYYLRHLIFLSRFCRRHRISAIQSHLQQANIVAVLAQYFVKAKTVIYRHHLIEPNRTSRLFDRVINRLAKTMVVPSSVIVEKMLGEEGVNPKKLKLIPYVYDFSRYKASPEKITEIQNMYPAKLRVLLCGRFVPLKRNELAIQAVSALVKQGKDVVLIALDSGPELDVCKSLVTRQGLEKHVFFVGYTPFALEYMAACDLLIHPSYTEASNNTVKEAALFSKLVLVCRGVGDFSDFIEDGVNGYLVNRDNPLPGMIRALETVYEGLCPPNMGSALKKTVLEKFDKSSGALYKHLDLLVN